jgi:hypothetical protein
MTSRCAILATALMSLGSSGLTQVPLRGRVLASENDQPLAGASVVALHTARATETDRHGRFVVWVQQLPETLVARFIGRAMDTVVVQDSSEHDILLRLSLTALPLVAVVVHGEPGQPADVAAGTAVWSLPREAVAAVPAAVEGDVFRGLALAPAVGYSTPLSSQPFVRGMDPGAVGYRLDGFTVINPFHLGRIFSALMPQAIQSARLAVAPFDTEFGDATSAVIDARLREGGDELRGGAQASFVSAAAWASGPARSHRWFVAWRHGFAEHIGGPFRDAPYRFNDVYGRFTVAAPWGPVYLTAFWSNDAVSERETDRGVGWSNALLGARIPLALGRAGRLEIWGETSGFREDVRQLPIRGADTDVRNRFATHAVGARLEWTGERSTVSFGSEIRRRRMLNRIDGGVLSAPDADVDGVVGAGDATIEHRAGRVAVRVGVRVDANADVTAWQPRLRLGARVSREWSIALAAGRTARLYHVIPEVLPEIEDILSVYDLWRPAGRDGTPLSATESVVLEVKRSHATVSLRASAFASRLHGVGEVRRTLLGSPDSGFFRFGDGRVWGTDVEITIAGARRSLSLAYVLSWSRRRWDDPQQPEISWRHDRRHQARAFTQWFIGRGWRVNLLADFSSADPITPALGTLEVGRLLSDGTLDRGASVAKLVLGPENSGRGGWMSHVDLGLQKELGGPGRSRGHLGISVLNVGFTRIAPAAPEVDYDEHLGVTRVIYRPRIFLPPIPTLTLSFDF